MALKKRASFSRKSVKTPKRHGGYSRIAKSAAAEDARAETARSRTYDLAVPLAGRGRSLVLELRIDEQHRPTRLTGKKPAAPPSSALRAKQFEERVLELLTLRVPEAIDRLNRSTCNLEDAEGVSAESVVDRMLASIPAASTLDERLGPFYSAASLASWRGVTRQAIHAQLKRHQLLAVQTADDVVLFPSFQFGIHGESLPGLVDVLALLRPTMPDPWSQALWLATPVPALGERSAADALANGSITEVLEVARRDIARRA